MEGRRGDLQNPWILNLWFYSSRTSSLDTHSCVFLGEEEEEVDIYVKTMEDMCNGVSVMKAKDGWGREMWMRVVAIEG